MSSNIANQAPYLISSRRFPPDLEDLLVELDKMYIEIANAVNQREISLYDKSSIITGEQWFRESGPTLSSGNTKRQTFRRVYSFDDSSLTFNHELGVLFIFTAIYGGAKNGTDFFPIPYVSTTLSDQIGIRCTSSQVIITKGGTSPAITNGVIVLEFLREE